MAFIFGGPGNDTLNGGAGNDTLNGFGGNDTINGKAGADRTNGGSGNDRIIDDDFVNFDIHNGGTGIDTIDYSNVTFSSGRVTINLNTETTSVSGGNTETIRNFENVEGSQGGETIIGTSGANRLDGNGGNDTINGGAGADRTFGGSGNDTIIDDDFVNFDIHNGGSGIDTIDYSNVTFGSGQVTINLATATTSVSGGNTETIRNFENVEGSQGGETIIGTSGANRLDGNGGNDTINGGAGADTIIGGIGNDTIIDDDFVNFDVHNGGSGIDTIDYSNVTFGSGFVTINLATSTTSVSGGNTETILRFENVEGSQGGETIIGTSGANRLDGNGGNDSITGAGGNDTLIGGLGSDTLNGTNSIVDGVGEIDILDPGDFGARDLVILGTSGSIYYNGAGLDYAVIDNFDRFNFAGETDSDKIQISGSLSNYTLTSFTGTISGVSITNGTRINLGAEIIAYVDSSGLLTAADFISV
ncbi:MAG: calcium-binding protein [Moorea sp. SIO4A3]|nr:calcium-binding protein [Moorena sp. SIO4A3]